MSELARAELDPKAQFFEQIGAVRTIMLGLSGGADQMQPMTALGADQGRILMFTSQDTELGSASPGPAWFTVTGKSHDYHAFAKGDLEICDDQGLRDALWSPFVAAWFPEGKDDPRVLLVEFRPHTAEIWASEGNPVVFGLDILKATLSGQQPDAGVRRTLTFDA